MGCKWMKTIFKYEKGMYTVMQKGSDAHDRGNEWINFLPIIHLMFFFAKIRENR